MDINKKFGDRIRQIRHEKGITQEQLALLSNLDRSYVGGVERGQRNISLKNIKKLAQALEVSLKELMDFNA